MKRAPIDQLLHAMESQGFDTFIVHYDEPEGIHSFRAKYENFEIGLAYSEHTTFFVASWKGTRNVTYHHASQKMEDLVTMLVQMADIPPKRRRKAKSVCEKYRQPCSLYGTMFSIAA